MERMLDGYIKASQSSVGVAGEFEKLRQGVAPKSRDPYRAAIEVKESLYKAGFKYDHRVFSIDSVLKKRSGNCLGLPLILGTLLQESGIPVKFAVVVNPKDKVFEAESVIFERLLQETPYDQPKLAIEQDGFSPYRFAPLEHLALKVDGRFVEATTLEPGFPECESVREITPSEALSFVYKDRAVFALERDEYQKARQLLQQGLRLWPENRQLYSLRAAIERMHFSDESADSAVLKFHSLALDDSLYHFDDFTLTLNARSLQRALQLNPTYAAAIASQADLISDRDLRESRFQYALASHLYAQSGTLDLADFYILFSENLSAIFGRKKVIDCLNKASHKIGDFDYHIALFKLTRDENYLAEAKEAVATPWHELIFLATANRTKYFDARRARILSKKYARSTLFKTLCADLNTSFD